MQVIDHPCEMIMDKEKRRELLFSETKGVEWESPRSNFKHRRLTKLIIFCFAHYMVSHVRHVMKTAVNLKDVYLYGRLSCSKCQHMAVARLPRSKKKLDAMKKLLTQGIDSAPRIHFLTPSPEMDTDHAARVCVFFKDSLSA